MLAHRTQVGEAVDVGVPVDSGGLSAERAGEDARQFGLVAQLVVPHEVVDVVAGVLANHQHLERGDERDVVGVADARDVAIVLWYGRVRTAAHLRVHPDGGILGDVGGLDRQSVHTTTLVVLDGDGVGAADVVLQVGLALPLVVLHAVAHVAHRYVQDAQLGGEGHAFPLAELGRAAEHGGVSSGLEEGRRHLHALTQTQALPTVERVDGREPVFAALGLLDGLRHVKDIEERRVGLNQRSEFVLRGVAQLDPLDVELPAARAVGLRELGGVEGGRRVVVGSVEHRHVPYDIGAVVAHVDGDIVGHHVAELVGPTTESIVLADIGVALVIEVHPDNVSVFVGVEGALDRVGRQVDLVVVAEIPHVVDDVLHLRGGIGEALLSQLHHRAGVRLVLLPQQPRAGRGDRARTRDPEAAPFGEVDALALHRCQVAVLTLRQPHLVELARTGPLELGDHVDRPVGRDVERGEVGVVRYRRREGAVIRHVIDGCVVDVHDGSEGVALIGVLLTPLGAISEDVHEGDVVVPAVDRHPLGAQHLVLLLLFGQRHILEMHRGIRDLAPHHAHRRQQQRQHSRCESHPVCEGGEGGRAVGGGR
mmetsp:Transcript_6693/g.19428  ORF Transcript_6693/g.19428 Transcript_6693/m.19428 type:complete len:593 (-) Transcript_6693:73-1851(-)